MNKVILIGRLTRDPELRNTPNGTPVCQITLAIDRAPDRNGNRQTDFINVVVWNKQAESVCRYITKGRMLAVEGRIQTRNYDDKDGKRVYVTEVVAINVQFIESKNSANNGGYSNNDYGYGSAMPYDNVGSQASFGGNSGVSSSTQTVTNGNANVSESAKPVETVDVSSDPFEAFGESLGDSVGFTDNDLPF